MILNAEFKETNHTMDANLGEVKTIGGFDAGYEEGYGDGYEEGHRTGYETGSADGWMDGKDEGYAEGKQAEYNLLWDAIQDSGNRTNYARGFQSPGWNDDSFTPKYDINFTNAGTCFNGSKIKDYVNCLSRNNVKMDFSKCTAIENCWQNALIERIGDLNLSSCSSFSGMFMNCWYLKEVGTVTFPTGKSLQYVFDGVSRLETINFAGTISYSGFVCKSNYLTHESLLSLLNVLEDNSASGTTKTCTIGTTNLAKLTDAEKAIATQKGWTLA